MKITLRKANAIQQSILDAMRSIDITTIISISEFEDPESAIKAANDLLIENDKRRAQLLTAFYNIRGLVSQANSEAGIDLLLTKAAFIDKRVAQIEDLATSRQMTDAKIIQGKLDKIRNAGDNSRIYEDKVSTSILVKSQIDHFKKQVKDLKKQKQQINDEVLELNVKTEIPLSDETVNAIAQEGLI